MYKYIITGITSVVIIYLLKINIERGRNIILNRYDKKSSSPLQCITYNIQRLPFYIKDHPFFLKTINADIICLQECFHNIFVDRLEFFKKLNYNICIPGVQNLTKWDSGLVILSKYTINFIDFVPFKYSSDIDKVSEKGFLVVKIKDLYVINTHLQSSYKDSPNVSIKTSQLDQINNYIMSNNLTNCLLLGDFNVNVDFINWSRINYQLIKSILPTNWDNHIHSTKYKKYPTQVSEWCDGGYLWSNKYKVKSIHNIDYDKYTDHLGISINID